MTYLPLAISLLVAVVTINCMPQRRDTDIGNPEVLPSYDGQDIGLPEILPEEEMLIMDETDARKRNAGDKEKRYYYYYYYSSSSSVPNIAPRPTPPSGPIIDHAADGGTGQAGGCTPEYQAMGVSTMCIFTDDPTVTEYGIPRSDIEAIVDIHNKYRGEEKAKDMATMYWDDNLAVIAQKLAQSCHKGHDTNDNRKVPGLDMGIGQNWCGGVTTWDVCIGLWHGEKKDFKYGASNSLEEVGHYTQIVNDKAVAVGCGYAYCPYTVRHNMVCNYAYGQTSKDVVRPFAAGTDCAKCPGHCVNGLCDCGKKICNNKGRLNLKTCQCSCMEPWMGVDCSEPDCTKPEYSGCGKGPYVLANCKRYKNLPGLCRRECEIC